MKLFRLTCVKRKAAIIDPRACAGYVLVRNSIADSFDLHFFLSVKIVKGWGKSKLSLIPADDLGFNFKLLARLLAI